MPPYVICASSVTVLRVAALLFIGSGALAFAQDVQEKAPDIRLAIQSDGRPLARIEVVLVQASGNHARDEAIVARLRVSLAGLEGRAYSRALVESSLAGPRSRMGAGQIDYRVLDASVVASVVLRVEVSTTAESASQEKSTAFPTFPLSF